MASFAGTSQKCTACTKTVYLVDKLTADSRIYHKACFRCHHCRNTLKVYFNYLICFFSTLIFLISIMLLYISSNYSFFFHFFFSMKVDPVSLLHGSLLFIPVSWACMLKYIFTVFFIMQIFIS